jgi:hypothetical protein
MTPIKSSFVVATISFGLGFLACLSTFKKPEPEIKYVEKIVEVEKKSAVIHRKIQILPDGTVNATEDELTEYLRNVNKMTALESKKSIRKEVLLFRSVKSVGIHVKYDFTENLTGGAGYFHEPFISVGLRF